jgi:uncharacterized protein YjbI with pentapeptide repeats
MPEPPEEQRRCPIKMSKVWLEQECGRPIHRFSGDETPVCLMHSRDPQKSEEEFQKEFDSILNNVGERTANFTAFVFPAARYLQREFKAECLFTRATFTQDANFDGAIFTQDANFGRATFTQDANFRVATFTQAADFSWATFTQDADFVRAIFTRAADFSWATFTRAADFSWATFTQDANFSGATFTQAADFSWATFTQDADFSMVTFTQDAHFRRATFTQVAHFWSAQFLESASFWETQFEQQKAGAPSLIFSQPKLAKPRQITFYRTNLANALFHHCDVSEVNFSTVEWPKRPNGKRMVFEELIGLKNEYASAIKPTEGSHEERNHGLIAELYQQLKKNYDDRRDYRTAGDFHHGEMEMKRLSTRVQNRWLRKCVQNLRLAAWYTLIALFLLAVRRQFRR